MVWNPILSRLLSSSCCLFCFQVSWYISLPSDGFKIHLSRALGSIAEGDVGIGSLGGTSSWARKDTCKMGPVTSYKWGEMTPYIQYKYRAFSTPGKPIHFRHLGVVTQFKFITIIGAHHVFLLSLFPWHGFFLKEFEKQVLWFLQESPLSVVEGSDTNPYKLFGI